MAGVVGAISYVCLDRIRIARDDGSEVEISGGLPADARIVASAPDWIAEGVEVRLAESAEVAAAELEPSWADPALAQSGRGQAE